MANDALALVLGGAGFALFAWCVTLLARVGRGTLAPWDPTRSMVAVGPYRLVRNPMITGVALMLFGEAAFWGSKRIGVWAVSFVFFNHLYFILSEEPGLERRFGSAYRQYKARAPRWLPRSLSAASQVDEPVSGVVRSGDPSDSA